MELLAVLLPDSAVAGCPSGVVKDLLRRFGIEIQTAAGVVLVALLTGHEGVVVNQGHRSLDRADGRLGDRFAIDCPADGVTDFLVLQCALLGVHRQVSPLHSLRLVDGAVFTVVRRLIRVAVGADIDDVDLLVRVSLSLLRLRHDLEDDLLELRGLAPPLVVAHHGDDTGLVVDALGLERTVGGQHLLGVLLVEDLGVLTDLIRQRSRNVVRPIDVGRLESHFHFVLVRPGFDRLDVFVALRRCDLVLVGLSVAGLPEGFVVLDVDRGAVFPHGVFVELDVDDQWVLAGDFNALCVVLVDLPRAVRFDGDPSAERGSVQIVVVDVRAVGVIVVQTRRNLRHRVGQSTAVGDLVVARLLVIGGRQCRDLLVRLVAVHSARAVVLLLAAGESQPQSGGRGDDHCRPSHPDHHCSCLSLSGLCWFSGGDRARRSAPNGGRPPGSRPRDSAADRSARTSAAVRGRAGGRAGSECGSCSR
ncbi:Uncharacterised protein [Mycobacteroides abscessus subsp. abscessus]|nr:Uncharacterised protein [Mycobacteroides abscessus subsp. abscessus]